MTVNALRQFDNIVGGLARKHGRGSVSVKESLRTDAVDALATRANGCRAFMRISAKLGPYQAMLSPPSITRAWPVMKDDRSETRNRIASATSSALAHRPIGILSRT